MSSWSSETLASCHLASRDKRLLRPSTAGDSRPNHNGIRVSMVFYFGLFKKVYSECGEYSPVLRVLRRASVDSALPVIIPLPLLRSESL